MTSRVLTDQQRRRIAAVIRDGHLAFLAEMLGAKAIDRDDYKRLRRAGKIRTEREQREDVAAAAHALGAGAASATGGEVTAPAFWKIVREHPTVIGSMERATVDLIRQRIAQHARDLGAQLESDVAHVLMDVEAKARHRVAKLGASKRDEERLIVQEALGQVREAVAEMKRRWSLIAVTETHNAVEDGKATALVRAHGGRDPLVFKLPRPDACAYCRLLYLKADGKTPRIFRLSGLMANGTNIGRKRGKPTLTGPLKTNLRPTLGAAHPLCFPSDCLVLTHRGEVPISTVKRGDMVLSHTGTWRPVLQVSQRWYADELVTVIHENGRLPSTLEHPFLTQRGWVPAKELGEGDYAMKVLSAKIPAPQVHDQPTFTRERNELVSILALFSRTRVPVTTVDLYRDLCLWYGDVDVEDTDGHERRYFDARFSEGCYELALQLGQFLRILDANSYFEFCSDRAWFSSNGIVRSLRALLPLGSGHSAVHEDPSLLASSDWKILLPESEDHRSSRALHSFRDRQNGLASVIAINDLADINVNAFHGAGTPWFCDAVPVKTLRTQFCGFVYNLHVAEDESYVCNGLVVHNCACQLNHVPEGMTVGPGGVLISLHKSESVQIDTLDVALLSHRCDTEVHEHGAP